MLKDKRKAEEKQAKAEEMECRLVKYVKPVLSELNEKMDRRLVKTLLGLVMAIVEHRHRNNVAGKKGDKEYPFERHYSTLVLKNGEVKE